MKRSVGWLAGSPCGPSLLFIASSLVSTAAVRADTAAQQPADSTTPVETVRQEVDGVSMVIVTAKRYVPEESTSANKSDIPLIETPQSVSVITRDQIDLLNFTDAQQAVRYAAGTYGESYGPDLRYDFLTVRGFTPKQVGELEPEIRIVDLFNGGQSTTEFAALNPNKRMPVLEDISTRPWFRRRGALVQTLVPPACYDVRVLVAGGEVVGAEERVAAPEEWRTNISLGGTHRRARVTPAARMLARAATAAVGADLAGVDLLPTDDGYVVIEVNGAVDFTSAYALDEHDAHVLRVTRELRLVCVFNPPLAGGETHDAQGGYLPATD